MQTNKTNKKELLVRSKGSKEALYYIFLFGAAFIVSVALLIYAATNHNSGLTVYSYVLMPTFLAATFVATRFYFISVNPIYSDDNYLYVKRFFITRKISIDKIEKLTVATFGKNHNTSVKIVYEGKTLKYQYKNIDKDAAAKLRRISK